MTTLVPQLSLKKDFEFHFNHNSGEIRHQLLSSINRAHYQYYGIIIDKSQINYHLSQFKTKTNLYSFAIAQLISYIQPTDSKITITLDKCGNEAFRQSLAKSTRTAIACKDSHLKFYQRDSKIIRLLQLADYIASILHYRVLDKSQWQKYYQHIRVHESTLIYFPNK